MTEETHENEATDNGTEKPDDVQIDQNSFDKGINTGIAKGRQKALNELLKDLGAANVDELKESVSLARKAKEEQLSIAERLQDLSGKYEQTSKELEEYRATARAKAEKMYEKLNEDQRSGVDAAGLPLEKLVPVMESMLAKPTAEKKKQVGTPTNPNKHQNAPQLKSKKGRPDPRYKEDKTSYIRQRMAELRGEQ